MLPSTIPRRSLSLIPERGDARTKARASRPTTRERNPYSATARTPVVTGSTETDSDGETASASATFDGPRFVLVLYVLLTAVGGVGGVLVATFVEGMTAPALYGVVTLPPTALGFGLYGAVTIATVLGVPLALVVYVSRRVDDPHAIEE